MKLLIYALLAYLIYKMMILPALEGYQHDDTKPRIKKNKPGRNIPDEEYTDYEEIE